MSYSNVRVRIAPSPTGFVHIGNLRTTLYNYLFAKRYEGKFLIRIEDTDRTRFVPGAVENLLEVLKWAGIEADEGPYLDSHNKIKEKGDCGPYVQSNRLDIYHDNIKTLLEKGKAYHCFCSKERLDKLRAEQEENKQAPKYDGFCRNLSKSEVESLLAKNTPHVIRFKMPENKEVVFHDIIRGEIIVNTKDLDDYVLIKADQFPTYHFASIVDDHTMKITHVLRGDEWLASAPKHVLLYESFGWNPPQFAHLPQLLNKNKKKLSKRDGDSSVKDFIKSGYLKDALINFIALLGWNAGTEQEIYTLNELTKQFSLDNVHKAGAVFDLDKLDWINGTYIRKLSVDEFYQECLPYISEVAKLEKNNFVFNKSNEKVGIANVKQILALEQSRIKKLSEIPGILEKYSLDSSLEYNPELLVWKKSDKPETINNLQSLIETLGGIEPTDFNKQNIEKILQALIESKGLGVGNMLWPMRFALSGLDKSPSPYELADALGKERTIARLQIALTKLASK